MILTKYLEFAYISSKKLAAKLFNRFNINKHLVNLKPGKKLLSGVIYGQKLVELEILKTYIETNLDNGFIWQSNFPVGALIFFVQKSDASLSLYVDYQGLNNLVIKNQYLFSLINELFN